MYQELSRLAAGTSAKLTQTPKLRETRTSRCRWQHRVPRQRRST